MIKKIILPALIALITFQLVTKNCSAQYNVILNFSGANDGKNPINGALIYDGSYLYGMTYAGGIKDSGVIFKVKPDGSGFMKMHDFKETSTNGTNPRGSFLLEGGSLYGMSSDGGRYGGGIIFKINPDGTSFSDLHDFNGAEGRYPLGSLVSDGTYFYGVTSDDDGTSGGTNSGVIFKMNMDGTGYVVLKKLNGTTEGKEPRGSLIYDGTYLYGMTRFGGTNSDGLIFKIKTDGTGYSTLYNFDGATNGKEPYGNLITDGTFLYGMTNSGGANNFGTCFRIKPDGTSYSKLFDFSGAANGQTPYGSLYYKSGYIYGVVAYGGGSGHFGVIFKMKPDGTNLTRLHEFTCGTDGCRPFGSLIADNTYLYGMTYMGGTNGNGTVFKYKYCTPAASSQTVTLCAGQSLTVGTETYTTSGTYTTTITSVGGCDSTVTTTIISNVNTPPSINITGTTTICKGITTTLTAGGTSTSYVWSGGAVANTATVTVTPTTTTGYTVTGTDVNGCNATASTMVTVNAPVIDITGTTTICNGTTTTLTASGTSTSYVWSVGATTTPAITVSPTTSTGYTVTGTDANSCTNTATTTVTVNQPVASSQTVALCNGQTLTVGTTTLSVTGNYTTTLTAANGCDSTVFTNLTINNGNNPPVINITGTNTICKGVTTILTASGASTYVWSGGTVASTATVAVTPPTTTGYTVTGTDGNGCKATASTTVTVNSPTISIAGTNTICNGETTTLTASGTSTSYVWSDGTNTNTSNPFIITPTTSTNYTVTGTDGSCSNTDSIKVIVNTLPAVAITGMNAICIGSSTSLTGTGAVSYVWSTGDVSAGIITTTLTTNTGYTVTGTDGNGCKSQATTTVTVNLLPVVTASNPSTVCAGKDVILSGGGAVTYVWSTNESTSAITVTPTTNTSYTVTGTDANSCSNTATTTVTLNALPIVAIAGTNTICNGASTTLTASGAISYVWSEGGSVATAIVVMPTTSTDYTVTGTDANSCSNTATATVTVNALPIVTITGVNTICIGSTTTLTGSGAATYVWSTNESALAISITPTTSTDYTVTGTDVNQCVNTSTTTVTVNPLPAISITGINTICNGYGTTLTGSGGVYYSWSTGSNATSIMVSPTTSTVYSLSGSDATSCVNSASVTITVNPLPDVTTSVLQSVITANQAGAAYQWLDCNNGSLPISGETNQTYTATVNGSYAVKVDLLGCVDTSTCDNIIINAVDEYFNSNLNMNTYPNPSSGVFTISTNANNYVLNIFNVLGDNVLSQKIQNQKHAIDLRNQPNGVYFIQLRTKNSIATKKIYIQK